MEYTATLQKNKQGIDPRSGFIDFNQLHPLIPTSARTLRNWIAQGLIPYVQMPGSKRHLFHWPTVQAALMRHQHGGKR